MTNLLRKTHYGSVKALTSSDGLLRGASWFPSKAALFGLSLFMFEIFLTLPDQTQILFYDSFCSCCFKHLSVQYEHIKCPRSASFRAIPPHCFNVHSECLTDSCLWHFFRLFYVTPQTTLELHVVGRWTELTVKTERMKKANTGNVSLFTNIPPI